MNQDPNPQPPNHQPDDASPDPDAMKVEQLLRATPLRQPGASLDERIFSAMADVDALVAPTSTPPSTFITRDHDAVEINATPARFIFSRWLAGAAALAACVALVVVIMNSSETPPIHNDQGSIHAIDFDPVRIEHVYSDVEPEGVVFVDDDTPVQRYRRQTVEHVQLIDDKRNIRIELTVPQEDVIVMPVNYD